MRSSVIGQIKPSESSASIKVSRKRSASASSVLEIGSTIVGRVTKITPRLAHVDIICIGETPLKDPCPGLLRREDVRPVDQQQSEAIEMHRCVRPGDVLLAKVLSPGDSRAYYLSTTANQHGVVIARSAEGATMRPVSWCEMECPVSHVREKRKVAKPQAPHLANSEQVNSETAK